MRLNEDLQQIIAAVLHTNMKSSRVVAFDFNHKKYWLKQTEQLTGFMRLLKANPKRALTRETEALQYLNNIGAPCAVLIQHGDGYLVLEDVGVTANQWFNNPAITVKQKQEIVKDCAIALAELHSLNLVHGRPATRDMGWDNGKVRFIDFESRLNIRQLEWNKKRDLLIFIHDLFRNSNLSQAMIESAVTAYRQHGGEQVWQQVVLFVNRSQVIYRLFKPFYRIAGKDLLASLKLFEYLMRKTA